MHSFLFFDEIANCVIETVCVFLCMFVSVCMCVDVCDTLVVNTIAQEGKLGHVIFGMSVYYHFCRGRRSILINRNQVVIPCEHDISRGRNLDVCHTCYLLVPH